MNNTKNEAERKNHAAAPPVDLLAAVLEHSDVSASEAGRAGIADDGGEGYVVGYSFSSRPGG